jgi:hypothetical protein
MQTPAQALSTTKEKAASGPLQVAAVAAAATASAGAS